MHEIDKNFLWECFQKGMSPVVFVSQPHLAFANPHSPAFGPRSDDARMWFLAFVPLLSALAMLGFGFVWGAILTVLANWILCSTDATNLKKQGFSPPSTWWAVFFVPCYVLMRPNRVGGGYGYAVAWMVCFVMSLAIPVPFP